MILVKVTTKGQRKHSTAHSFSIDAIIYEFNIDVDSHISCHISESYFVRYNDICACSYGNNKHSTADIILHYSGHTHHIRFASIAQQVSSVLF